jgi:hypothetical protein
VRDFPAYVRLWDTARLGDAGISGRCLPGEGGSEWEGGCFELEGLPKPLGKEAVRSMVRLVVGVLGSLVIDESVFDLPSIRFATLLGDADTCLLDEAKDAVASSNICERSRASLGFCFGKDDDGSESSLSFF